MSNEDKNLKIRKSNAMKLYLGGKPDQKEFLETLWPGEFKPIDVTDRIKTWDDVLADQGVTAEEFAKRIANDEEDEAAYKRMKLLARALNELKPGEELDPAKTWYFPVFNRVAGFGFACVRATFIGFRLRMSGSAFLIKSRGLPGMPAKLSPRYSNHLC